MIVTEPEEFTDVFKVRGRVSRVSASMFIEVGPQGNKRYYHGQDWHTSERAAWQRVADMVASGRTSCKKRLKKLDDLWKLAKEKLS